MIDDDATRPGEEKLATWKVILVEWCYNKKVECLRRMEVANGLEDFKKIWKTDNGTEFDVIQ